MYRGRTSDWNGLSMLTILQVYSKVHHLVRSWFSFIWYIDNLQSCYQSWKLFTCCSSCILVARSFDEKSLMIQGSIFAWYAASSNNKPTCNREKKINCCFGYHKKNTSWKFPLLENISGTRWNRIVYYMKKFRNVTSTFE